MDPQDLATLIEVKLKALAMKFDPKTSSFEVRVPDEVPLEKVIKEGLEWKGRIFPIERPYKPRDEFFEVKLAGLPLEEVKWVTEQIRIAFGEPKNILRVTPVLCLGSSLHCGEFVVAIRGKVEDMEGRGRHITIADREIFVAWPGAQVVCRKCKKEGHRPSECREKGSERQREEEQAKQTRFRPHQLQQRDEWWGPRGPPTQQRWQGQGGLGQSGRPQSGPAG